MTESQHLPAIQLCMTLVCLMVMIFYARHIRGELAIVWRNFMESWSQQALRVRHAIAATIASLVLISPILLAAFEAADHAGILRLVSS